MIPSMRPANVGDINYLMDVDLKSYDYPWTLDEWRKYLEDLTCTTLLASYKVEPVSVCVWQNKPGIDEAEILKLATKPAYRNQGAGLFLVNAVIMAAADYKLSNISIIVPEIKCFPGHPDDVSQWLLNRGFHAIVPILKRHFRMYGARCDGFKFMLEIGEKENA